MTKQQLEIIEKLNAIQSRIKQLQNEIDILLPEQDKLTEQLFNTIEPPKVKKKV